MDRTDNSNEFYDKLVTTVKDLTYEKRECFLWPLFGAPRIQAESSRHHRQTPFVLSLRKMF